jgi:hypothetical protein
MGRGVLQYAPTVMSLTTNHSPKSCFGKALPALCLPWRFKFQPLRFKFQPLPFKTQAVRFKYQAMLFLAQKKSSNPSVPMSFREAKRREILPYLGLPI